MRLLRRFFLPFLFLLFLLSFHSCKNFTGGALSEGEIIYTVTYPGTQNNMMVNLFPSEMKMKFKNGKVLSDFSTSMGLFSASGISDPEKKTFTQLVKVLNDKKGIVFKKKEVDQLIAEEPKINIEFLPETKMILGYKCKKAHISFVDDKKEGFDLFYTNEIHVPKANWWTPFREIDGVILEYRVSRYNIDMKLVAKEVIEKEIEDEIFNFPKDYKMVSRAEIDEVFSNLQ